MQIRSSSYDEIKEEMDRIKTERACLRENEIESYYQLFRFPLLRPFLLGTGIHTLQQLTGINATLYYAPDMFKQLSTNYNDSFMKNPLMAPGVYGTVNFLFTIPTMIFIDKLGRRFLLILGAMIMFISLLIVSIFTSCVVNGDTDQLFCIHIPNLDTIRWIIIIFIHVFIVGFAFSWGPIPCIYCTEIFPLTMRAKGTSLTLAANWATDCLVSFCTPLVLKKYGWHCISFLF